MTRIAAALALLLFSTFADPLAVSAATIDSAVYPEQPAPAQEGEPVEAVPKSDAWGEVVIWSIVGLGIFAAIGGVLYYFKRQVGGFPENPSWVAPITIMESKDFPDEGDFGEPAPSHGVHQ